METLKICQFYSDSLQFFLINCILDFKMVVDAIVNENANRPLDLVAKKELNINFNTLRL
jgi:hypothetical protein